jgi:hypothetical protein
MISSPYQVILYLLQNGILISNEIEFNVSRTLIWKLHSFLNEIIDFIIENFNYVEFPIIYISCSIVALAREILNLEKWPELLQKAYNLNLETFQTCFQTVKRVYYDVRNSGQYICLDIQSNRKDSKEKEEAILKKFPMSNPDSEKNVLKVIETKILKPNNNFLKLPTSNTSRDDKKYHSRSQEHIQNTYAHYQPPLNNISKKKSTLKQYNIKKVERSVDKKSDYPSEDSNKENYNNKYILTTENGPLMTDCGFKLRRISRQNEVNQEKQILNKTADEQQININENKNLKPTPVIIIKDKQLIRNHTPDPVKPQLPLKVPPVKYKIDHIVQQPNRGVINTISNNNNSFINHKSQFYNITSNIRNIKKDILNLNRNEPQSQRKNTHEIPTAFQLDEKLNKMKHRSDIKAFSVIKRYTQGFNLESIKKITPFVVSNK